MPEHSLHVVILPENKLNLKSLILLDNQWDIQVFIWKLTLVQKCARICEHSLGPGLSFLRNHRYRKWSWAIHSLSSLIWGIWGVRRPRTPFTASSVLFAECTLYPQNTSWLVRVPVSKPLWIIYTPCVLHLSLKLSSCHSHCDRKWSKSIHSTVEETNGGSSTLALHFQ